MANALKQQPDHPFFITSYTCWPAGGVARFEPIELALFQPIQLAWFAPIWVAWFHRYIHQVVDDVQKEQIDLMNKYKLYRTKISHLKLRLDAAEEDEWRTLMPEAEDVFDNAERLLVYPSK